MGRRVDMMVALHDGASSGIKNISERIEALNHQLERTDKDLETVGKKKATIQVDTKMAQREAADAQKQFNKTGAEIDKTNAIAAQFNLDKMKNELKEVTAEEKELRKSAEAMNDELSRLQNRAESGGGSGGSGDSSLLNSLVAAGATQMIGGVAKNALTTFASSALGDRGGQAFESVLESAVSGATIGSMIAPGIGTAVGALAGAALGSIQAAINDYKIRDDAFKGEVQALYETVTTKIAESAQSGSELAASREMTRASFNVLLGGEDAAGEFLEGIQDMANRTPFLYDDLTSMSKTLKASGMENDALLPALITLGDAGGALGMATSDIADVGARLAYMMQSDKVSQMDIKSFALKGIDAFGYLSDSMGVSVSEMLEMVSSGAVSGVEAANVILGGLKEYEGGMDLLAATYEGLTGTIEELWSNLDAAYGESYNSARMDGLSAEQEWLEGFAGNGMAEWQSAIGGAHAELDNTAAAVRRGVMDAFTSGDMSGLADAMGGKLTEADESRLAGLAERYASAMAEGNGFELEALLGVAEAEAETLMANTEIATAQHEAQLQMIEGIQQAEKANNLLADRALETSDALSKGMASVTSSVDTGSANIVSAISRSRGFGSETSSTPTSSNPRSRYYSNAWGQQRVPYDGYVTELHEGERVLTAQQARAGEGNVPSVSVQVYGLTVREEADVERIAAALVREIALAQSVAI